MCTMRTRTRGTVQFEPYSSSRVVVVVVAAADVRRCWLFACWRAFRPHTCAHAHAHKCYVINERARTREHTLGMLFCVCARAICVEGLCDSASAPRSAQRRSSGGLSWIPQVYNACAHIQLVMCVCGMESVRSMCRTRGRCVVWFGLGEHRAVSMEYASAGSGSYQHWADQRNYCFNVYGAEQWLDKYRYYSIITNSFKWIMTGLRVCVMGLCESFENIVKTRYLVVKLR